MHLFPQTVSPSEVAVKSENQAHVLALGRAEGEVQDLSFLKPSLIVTSFLKYFCSSCTFFIVLSLKKAFADVAISQGYWVDVGLSSGSGW